MTIVRGRSLYLLSLNGRPEMYELLAESQIEDVNKRYSDHARSSRRVKELFISNGR